MQPTSKKIKNIHVELSNSGLLGNYGLCYETRKCDYIKEEDQLQKCVVKIIKTQECSLDQSYFWSMFYEFAKDNQCAYLVESLAFHKTVNNLYIVFERKQMNLYLFLKKINKSLKKDYILEFLFQATQALSFLQKRNSFHGNIKLSNIFVNIIDGRIFYSLGDYYGCNPHLNQAILQILLIKNLRNQDLSIFISPELQNSAANFTSVVAQILIQNQELGSIRQLINRMIDQNPSTRINFEELYSCLTMMKEIIKQNNQIKIKEQIISKQDNETISQLYYNKVIFYLRLIQMIEMNFKQLLAVKLPQFRLNQLILACHITVMYSLNKALMFQKDNELQQQQLSYNFFIKKILLIFKDYISDLEIYAQVKHRNNELLKFLEQIKLYLLNYQILPDEKIITDTLNQLKEEIIEKEVLRRLEIENIDLQVIKCILLLISLTKIENTYFLENPTQVHDYCALFMQIQETPFKQLSKHIS